MKKYKDVIIVDEDNRPMSWSESNEQLVMCTNDTWEDEHTPVETYTVKKAQRLIAKTIANRNRWNMSMPDSIHKGDIIYLDDEANVFWVDYKGYTADELTKYPHLFQPLPWYAEREVSEMPEYVRWVEATNFTVGKVIRWEYNHGHLECLTNIGDGNRWDSPAESSLVPATREEYQYTQTKQTNE